MVAWVRTCCRFLQPFTRFPFGLQLLYPQKSKTSRPQTLKMVNQPAAKRPMCPSCSMPVRVCLCSRIRTPRLNNSVGVTILQHRLEQRHALNSARIAKLGLKKVTVAPVSDVIFGAQISIYLLESDSHLGSPEIVSKCSDSIGGKIGILDLEMKGESEYPDEKSDEIDASFGDFSFRSDSGEVGYSPNLEEDGDFLLNSESSDTLSVKDPVLTITLDKCANVSSFTHKLLLEPQLQVQELTIDQFLASKRAVSALTRKGFVARMLQKRQVRESQELEEFAEFEIAIPPGSALLYPSQRSVAAEEIGFEVRHLIVLDGTWQKAKRVYMQNPWLKLLPHLKLDLDEVSLYAEVRKQPKVGYLSTIESIVHALKAVGDNVEGLDSLLDVFESMVTDQRRFKDANASKMSAG